MRGGSAGNCVSVAPSRRICTPARIRVGRLTVLTGPPASMKSTILAAIYRRAGGGQWLRYPELDVEVEGLPRRRGYTAWLGVERAAAWCSEESVAEHSGVKRLMELQLEALSLLPRGAPLEEAVREVNDWVLEAAKLIGADADVVMPYRVTAEYEAVKVTDGLPLLQPRVMVEDVRLGVRVDLRRASGVVAAALVLHAAALLYAVNSVARGEGLLAVEDPELGCHPHGQFIVGYVLGRLAYRREARTRVAVTTHSSIVLEGLLAGAAEGEEAERRATGVRAPRPLVYVMRTAKARSGEEEVIQVEPVEWWFSGGLEGMLADRVRYDFAPKRALEVWGARQ